MIAIRVRSAAQAWLDYVRVREIVLFSPMKQDCNIMSNEGRLYYLVQ